MAARGQVWATSRWATLSASGQVAVTSRCSSVTVDTSGQRAVLILSSPSRRDNLARRTPELAADLECLDAGRRPLATPLRARQLAVAWFSSASASVSDLWETTMPLLATAWLNHELPGRTVEDVASWTGAYLDSVSDAELRYPQAVAVLLASSPYGTKWVAQLVSGDHSVQQRRLLGQCRRRSGRPGYTQQGAEQLPRVAQWDSEEHGPLRSADAELRRQYQKRYKQAWRARKRQDEDTADGLCEERIAYLESRLMDGCRPDDVDYEAGDEIFWQRAGFNWKP